MFPMMKASFAAILSGVLVSFLKVDDKDIQAKLLGNDGKVSLKNVKVRERKIKLSNHGDNVICYLVIAGTSTISQLDLAWKWTSGNAASWKVAKGIILENSVLFIKGVKLKVSFRFEKVEYDDESTEKSQKEDRVSRNNNLHENEGKKKKPLSSLLNEEWGRLRRATIGNLKETELAHQITQNLLNSVTFTMDDIKIELVVPFTGTFIELGLKSGKFGNMDQDDEGAKIRSGPLMLEILLEKLYVNLHSGDPRASKKKTLLHLRRSTFESVVPILEPLSYKATIRRATGTRFTTWLNGFEVVGREHSVINRFSLQQETGITFHHSDEAMRAFEQIRSACRGQGHEIDYDSEIYNMHNEEPPVEKWPVSAKYILVLLSWTFIAVGLVAVSFAFRIMGIFQNSKLATIGLLVTGIFQSVRVAIKIVAKIDFENNEGKLLRRARRRHREKKVHDYPATFRLPFPYVTVVSSNKVQLTITKLSVMGRVDRSKIHVSADGLNVTSNTSRLRGPNVSMAAIRATHVDSTTLVNIDRIDSIFIPGRFLAEKPLVGTVITFDEGRMEIKLRSVRGRILKANEDIPEENYLAARERELPDFKKVAATVDRTRKKVNVEMQKGLDMLKKHEDRVKIAPVTVKDEIDSRNRMNAEVYESLFKLQILAKMFEQIPVQRNRENLRLYPQSFRGSEAVSFVLENNMAGSRREAVKLLKDMEVQFDLYESVSREYRFRDDYHALFRFKDPSKRRCWNRNDLPYDFIEGFDRTPQSSPIPFPISILVNRVSLSRYDAEEDKILFIATNGEVYLEQGKLARAIDATICLGELKTDMIAASNARVRGVLDPKYPKLIHRFQVSCDSAQVNPSLTTDDWFSFLGFDMTEEDDADASRRVSSMSQNPERPVAEPFLLPYMVIPEFLLQLSWRGVMIKANQSSIKVPCFVGTETTNSDDLVKLFVIKILGQTPGVLANVNFMGVNLLQSAGIATAIDIGAKVVPGGTYVGMLALVTYDSFCTAMDAGKAARHDPTGKYRAGDLFRGLLSSGGEITRHGAKIRGKSDEDYYDEKDRVQLDPIDFVVGAGHNTATYANENKARFAGAYTATAVMIATTVFLGPIGGIAAGIVAGAATEAGVHFVEDQMFKKAQPEEEAMESDDDDDGDS